MAYLQRAEVMAMSWSWEKQLFGISTEVFRMHKNRLAEILSMVVVQLFAVTVVLHRGFHSLHVKMKLIHFEGKVVGMD